MMAEYVTALFILIAFVTDYSAAVGENCTEAAGGADRCRDIANTFCYQGQSCQCNAGYAGDPCQPNAVLGEECADDDACIVDSSDCEGSVCACDTGYMQIDTECQEATTTTSSNVGVTTVTTSSTISTTGAGPGVNNNNGGTRRLPALLTQILLTVFSVVFRK